MTVTEAAIEFEPDGGLFGTGRWYVNSDVWFEIDPLTGGEGFVVYRCHIIEDDPDEDWDSDWGGWFKTRKAAVAAIPAFVAEERAAAQPPADDSKGG